MSTALADRVRERIAELEEARDQELEQVEAGYKALIDELKGILGEGPEPDEGNDEEPAADVRPPAKAKRKKLAAEAHANGNGKPVGKTVQRIRDLLAEKGPLKTGEIAEELGLALQTVPYNVAGNPWFETVDPANRLSPWRLTEVGRAGA